jgi:hypothetical protein
LGAVEFRRWSAWGSIILFSDFLLQAQDVSLSEAKAIYRQKTIQQSAKVEVSLFSPSDPQTFASLLIESFFSKMQEPNKSILTGFEWLHFFYFHLAFSLFFPPARNILYGLLALKA